MYKKISHSVFWRQKKLLDKYLFRYLETTACIDGFCIFKNVSEPKIDAVMTFSKVSLEIPSSKVWQKPIFIKLCKNKILRVLNVSTFYRVIIICFNTQMKLFLIFTIL